MIKECKVTLRNEINMVVVFDEIEIQMPSDNTKSSTVFVKHEDGKYSISNKSEYEKSLKITKSKNKTEKEIVSDDKTLDNSELN